VPFLARIAETIPLLLPLLATALGFGALLWGAHRILIGRRPDLRNERMFLRQLIMMGLTIAGVVALALALPVNESSRNQIIALIGLVISAVFAFSSGSIFANLMAGILLRVTGPFRIGDFIYVRDHFGRVTERGLFDTEIQSENRELIAIPNSYLISNPVTRVRKSGAIVTASLSLGYDVHHSRIEPLLIEAAANSGLEEPFVHILELGNFSITYRVSGVLAEVKGLITARSNLQRAVLDMLHGHSIEIVSPTFMNQRPMAEDRKTIPPPAIDQPSEKPPAAEKIVFDKAELAEQIDEEKSILTGNIQELEKALKEAPEEDKNRIKETIEVSRERLKTLEQAVSVSDKEEPAENAPARADRPHS
jgi:small conductance mechanosensitive channel